MIASFRLITFVCLGQTSYQTILLSECQRVVISDRYVTVPSIQIVTHKILACVGCTSSSPAKKTCHVRCYRTRQGTNDCTLPAIVTSPAELCSCMCAATIQWWLLFLSLSSICGYYLMTAAFSGFGFCLNNCGTCMYGFCTTTNIKGLQTINPCLQLV